MKFVRERGGTYEVGGIVIESKAIAKGIERLANLHQFALPQTQSRNRHWHKHGTHTGTDWHTNQARTN
jgi:hypothetical protein